MLDASMNRNIVHSSQWSQTMLVFGIQGKHNNITLSFQQGALFASSKSTWDRKCGRPKQEPDWDPLHIPNQENHPPPHKLVFQAWEPSFPPRQSIFLVAWFNSNNKSGRTQKVCFHTLQKIKEKNHAFQFHKSLNTNKEESCGSDTRHCRAWGFNRDFFSILNWENKMKKWKWKQFKTLSLHREIDMT